MKVLVFLGQDYETTNGLGTLHQVLSRIPSVEEFGALLCSARHRGGFPLNPDFASLLIIVDDGRIFQLDWGIELYTDEAAARAVGAVYTRPYDGGRSPLHCKGLLEFETPIGLRIPGVEYIKGLESLQHALRVEAPEGASSGT